MACLMICALFAPEIAIAQSTGVKLAPERTIFNDADSFKNSVPLHRNVLDVLIASLKDDEHYRDLFFGKSDIDLNRYFTAVVVHLSGSNEIDYVVQGNLPLAGADCGWFWIVRSAPTHPKVVLFEPTGTIELLNSRTRGYRDIRSVWIMSGHRRTRLFHFNGTEYKRIEEKWSADVH
jgi:hypothetical protein